MKDLAKTELVATIARGKSAQIEKMVEANLNSLIMKTKQTSLGKLTPSTKAYKVRAKVIEKSQPQQSPNKKRYQRLVCEDTEGNHLGGTLFSDEIDTFKDILQLGKEYEIANAPLKPIDSKYQKREDDCRMTFGGQTIIETTRPNYRFSCCCPLHRKGQESTNIRRKLDGVREIIVTDQRTKQPVTISMWGGLAVIDTEKLAGVPDCFASLRAVAFFFCFGEASLTAGYDCEA
uniref:Uncharacterized protein n=1 Tax=Chenopodium quinoa TaxID=63459 RepID=A0A803N228_CHEQI